MILTLAEAREHLSIRFPVGNNIPYWMDWRGQRGLPSDRDFYIVGIAPHNYLDLVAFGYGIKEEYGNGSIFLNPSELIFKQP